MKRARFVLAIIIATAPPLAGHTASQTGVRLDLPPGYFAAKPEMAPRKASAASPDDCASHCINFDDGFAWAGARKFTVEEQCHGHSRAFVEGCMIYVTERRRQNR
jgi:hypothetical protein